MNTTHTPGPWTLGEKRDSCRRVNDPEGFGIVSVIATDEQSEANAALLAAAPELLEALKAITDRFAASGDPTASDLMRNARSVIAKAEGM